MIMDKIDTLKKFLTDNPEDNFLQHALALEYVKLGNDGEARVLFEQILARDPKYIGSYYHLGKLLERIGEREEAMGTYQAGMVECRKAGDNHTYNELQAALEDLEDGG